MYNDAITQGIKNQGFQLTEILQGIVETGSRVRHYLS